MWQTMPSGSYSPAFADLAAHASGLKTRAAASGVPVKTFEISKAAVTAERKILDEPPESAENTQ